MLVADTDSDTQTSALGLAVYRKVPLGLNDLYMGQMFQLYLLLLFRKSRSLSNFYPESFPDLFVRVCTILLLS